MENRYLNSVSYRKFARWWLTGMLFVILYKNVIGLSVKTWSKTLSVLVNHIDEITIIVLLPLAIVSICNTRKIFDRLYIILLIPIILLIFVGFISGAVNGNSLLISALGILDYIKYFLVIFIYAAFFKELDVFRKIFRLLLIMAVFLGVVAFIQEIWALVSIYILKKDISDISIYIFRPIFYQNQFDYWRFGIYRTSSLIGHPNTFGLYCLLFFTIYQAIRKKINFIIIIPLLAGIFLSLSRIVYTGFIVVAGQRIFKGNKGFIVLVVIMIAVLLSTLNPFFEVDMRKRQHETGFTTYREYARQKAIEVWKDHYVWGVGPGMFGGDVSARFESPVFKEYNFEEIFYFRKLKSLDQFWPQVMAEMGIIGLVNFAGIFISLLIICFSMRRRAHTDWLKGLSTGLAASTLLILIYTVSSVLNVASFLFTYSAFVGMAMGCLSHSQNRLDSDQ